MKKVFGFLALVAAFAACLSVFSCKNSSDSDDYTVGTWVLKGYTLDSTSTSVEYKYKYFNTRNDYGAIVTTKNTGASTRKEDKVKYKKSGTPSNYKLVEESDATTYNDVSGDKLSRTVKKSEERVTSSSETYSSEMETWTYFTDGSEKTHTYEQEESEEVYFDELLPHPVRKSYRHVSTEVDTNGKEESHDSSSEYGIELQSTEDGVKVYKVFATGSVTDGESNELSTSYRLYKVSKVSKTQNGKKASRKIEELEYLQKTTGTLEGDAPEYEMYSRSVYFYSGNNCVSETEYAVVGGKSGDVERSIETTYSGNRIREEVETYGATKTTTTYSYAKKAKSINPDFQDVYVNGSSQVYYTVKTKGTTATVEAHRSYYPDVTYTYKMRTIPF